MTTPRTASSPADDDSLILLVLACFAGPAVLAYFWKQALAWLLDHQVLLPAASNPLVALPASDGAGPDLPRLLLVGAIALGLLAYLGHRMRGAIQARRQRNLQ
ncbi:hypothetical protein [Klenkia sp. PcliD-1-E]|uniref:hypothetical protein n=1 Tax=Klenkia sp. PcliD-1-E TaxID=2954492 RepID=UPI0020985C54|nr:hypothetical protein [Klenkia sp. PcliD-1-E]MCO7219517.1 hypothetical protein [Klenkia sp. PcliD-1-E]